MPTTKKVVQSQLQIMQPGAQSQSLKCSWSREEVVLVYPSRGTARVICPHGARGFCKFANEVCYVLKSASRAPSLKAAEARAGTIRLHSMLGLPIPPHRDD